MAERLDERLLAWETQYTVRGKTKRRLVVGSPFVTELRPPSPSFQSFTHPVPFTETLLALGVSDCAGEKRLRCRLYDGREAELTDTLAPSPHQLRPLNADQWLSLCRLGDIRVGYAGMKNIPLKVTGWSFDHAHPEDNLLLGVQTPMEVACGGVAGKVIAVALFRLAKEDNCCSFFLLEDGRRVPLTGMPSPR